MLETQLDLKSLNGWRVMRCQDFHVVGDLANILHMFLCIVIYVYLPLYSEYRESVALRYPFKAMCEESRRIHLLQPMILVKTLWV